jgi:hypothetical protein
MTSKHADLLNRLVDMRSTYIYALRRSLIEEAERLIDQEKEIDQLRLEAGIGKAGDTSALVQLLLLGGYITEDKSFLYCDTHWYTQEGKVYARHHTR